MIQLSKAQQEVVDKMKEGWRLDYNTNYGAVLLSKSTEMSWIKINRRVFTCLESKKIIEKCGYSYPTRYFNLTEKYLNNEQ